MIYIDIGRREQGKTTLGAFMIQDLPVRMVFDPRGMFGGEGRCETRAELAREFRRLEHGQTRQIVYTPDVEVQEGFEDFAQFARAAVKRCPDSIGILIDEAAFVDTERTKDLQWILRCASRTRVHIILTAHRPSDISTKVRAIADFWLLFHMRQEHDLEVVEQRCGSRVRDIVTGLKAREFVSWNDTDGTFLIFRKSGKWFIQLRTEPERMRDLLLDVEGESDPTLAGLPFE